MSEAHTPPPGAFDTMIVTLKLLTNLQEKENFIEVVCDRIKESSGRGGVRQFIEVDNNRALISRQVAGSAIKW